MPSSSPALTSGFSRIVKRGFYCSFDLNLNFKKHNMAFFTLLGFLFLVSLMYDQENVGKNIFKKRHFLYVNRIM